MDLRFALLLGAPAKGSSGAALGSALLALPALVAGHAGLTATFLAAMMIAGLAVLERSRQPVAPTRRPTPSVPALRLVRGGAPVRARWEVVDRDGRRALVMHWR